MIEVKNLHMKYEDKEIFKGFNVTFEDNSVYAILGKSGCGKSTLLRLIAGLIKPNSGEIYYDKNLVKKPNADICMMHQNYTNFDWKNCLDNVLFGVCHSTKPTVNQIKEAKKMLAIVGLEECELKYPYQLSGGMKQRLALARTLMNRPKVLLMDEPLSALDPKTRLEMQDLVLSLHKETQNTVIMVTHSEEEAKRMCDSYIRI